MLKRTGYTNLKKWGTKYYLSSAHMTALSGGVVQNIEGLIFNEHGESQSFENPSITLTTGFFCLA